MLQKSGLITSYLNDGIALKNISIFLSLSSYKIPILICDSLVEQEKIASFLGAVDARLTQLRRKHELLQTYKRGVMQKIFSQQIRFKQDDGTPFPDWQEKKISDLGKLLNGLIGKRAEDFGQGKPYITYKQVFDSTYIKLADLHQISSLWLCIFRTQRKTKFG